MITTRAPDGANKEKERESFFELRLEKKEILKVETLECMKYAAACFSAAVNSSYIFDQGFMFDLTRRHLRSASGRGKRYEMHFRKLCKM